MENSIWKRLTLALTPSARRGNIETQRKVSAPAIYPGVFKMLEKKRIGMKSPLLTCTLALGLILAAVAEPVLAVCNTAGCYGETLMRVWIRQDGKIWFVTDTPTNLASLDLVDGCVLQNVWAGGAVVPALYIPRDHPEYEHKYTMLLMAYTTGATIGFNMEKDPVNGWCALGGLYVD